MYIRILSAGLALVALSGSAYAYHVPPPPKCVTPR
jgi:hypothetical protein